jgi:HSP20 family molecular chaperone IbpA
MSTRVLWGVVALLGVTCIAEGSYIASNRRAERPPDAANPAVDPVRDLDKWEQRLQSDLASAGRLEDRDFDRLFGDDFFRQRIDPFAEIDKVGREIGNRLEGRDRELFGSAFRNWFEKRIDLTGITSKVQDKGKNVAVTFEIPGLDTDTVKLDVNADRIRLSYGALKTEKKGKTTTEAVASFEKIIPLPDGVDPTGFTVQKGKNELTVVFRKAGHTA